MILAGSLLAGAEKIKITQDFSIIFDRDSSSSRTFIAILIGGGMRVEPENQHGVAYITTQLAVDIVDSHKRKKIIEMGSRINFNIEPDFCVISINCLSDYLAETLEIFSQNFKRPLFSGLRVNRLKKYLPHLQTSEQDNDIALMILCFKEAFLKSSGYSGSIYGKDGSVKKISPRQVSRYYQDHFFLDNMTMAVSSDLEDSQINPHIIKLISDLPRGEKRTLGLIPITIPEKNVYFIQKDREQSLIAFGVCVDRLDPVHAAYTFLLENWIGKGAGSLLWALREDEKLAYTVNAFTIQMKTLGIFTLYLKTDSQKTGEAYQKMNQLVSNLYETEVSRSRLEIHKNHARADLLRLNETKDPRLYNLAFYEALGLGYSYFETLETEIAKINVQNFNEFKNTVLKPENLVRVIIGPENPQPPEGL